MQTTHSILTPPICKLPPPSISPSSLFVHKKKKKIGRGGRLVGRVRERISSSLHTQQGARHQVRSHNPEVMTQAKIKSQVLN